MPYLIVATAKRLAIKCGVLAVVGCSTLKTCKMGLDMYLYRVPKVDTIEELKQMNDRLDAAFIAGADLHDF